GIDKKVMKKIFQPYFTTKIHNRGSGLGLAVSHGIITSFGGNIDVKSEPGKGTCFSVYLPIFDGKEQAVSQPVYKLVKGHSKRILIIDDEQSIIILLKKMLVKSGFRVEGFLNSVLALKKLKAFSSDYDLIISDLTMPNMMGDEFCLKAKSINPKIPIILLTGYNESKVLEKPFPTGIDRVLAKPVEKNHLLTVISELIK
ncbi:MAG: response regulator, partial [Deltaproteobacteria bacterium]|nr:response regulator [Deltaproteobacteria bacterium]